MTIGRIGNELFRKSANPGTVGWKRQNGRKPPSEGTGTVCGRTDFFSLRGIRLRTAAERRDGGPKPTFEFGEMGA